METFREVGLLAWPIFVAGALGSLVSIVALLLAAKRAPSALRVAVAATVLGALAALFGGAGVLYLRHVTEAAIVDTRASPLQAEKLRREGYGEARRPARLGLLCAAFPLLAGTFAMFAGRRRRPSLEAALADPDVVRPARPGLALPIVMTVAGVLSAGVSAAGATAPLPGRAIPLDAADWMVLEHVELIQKAEGSEELLVACRRLELDLEDGLASPIPELPAVARRCVEDRVAQAAILAPIERVHRALEAIARSPLAQRDAPTLQMVQRDLDEVAKIMAEPAPFDPDDLRTFRTMPPQLRMGAVNVNGRLPPEVVQRIVRQSFGRFRLCYQSGLGVNPSLAGRVSVRFLIGRNGETRQITNAESTMPDATVVACVLRAFEGLSFPQPDDGTVVVTLPITFSPGA
jgi:hypothetical protein